MYSVRKNIEALVKMAAQIDERARVGRVQRLFATPKLYLDHITLIAAKVFEAEVCALTIIDEKLAIIKSSYGWEGESILPREDSLCARVMYDSAPTVVIAPKEDIISSDLKFFHGEDSFQFYASAALITSDGLPLGSLCVLDRRTKTQISEDQLEVLKSLASLAIAMIES